MVAGAGAKPGLTVCGFCIFAVQFYPLATLKVGGRPLFWWAPEPGWTRLLTRRFLADSQRVLAASSDQFLNLRWASTQLLRAARGALDDLDSPPDWLSREKRPPLCDIVGIHATNYGSGPDYDELRIPRNLLEFWSEARSSFGAIYQQIETEAWESQVKPKSSKQKAANPSPVPELARRNRLYEALGEAFRSPDFCREAKGVAAKFFLRRKGKSVAPNTSALAEFFLEKVAGMEKARLEAIREMADSIADNLILAKRDRQAASQLFRRRLKPGEFMQCISQVQRKLSDAGRPFVWDRVLLALGLASEEDRTPTDTWLVQELMLIRLYERLAQSEILTELPEPQAEESSKDESTAR
jgi:CRISPR-associated protein Cst1